MTELRMKKIKKKNKVLTYIRPLPFSLWVCPCDKENERVFVFGPLAIVDLLLSLIHLQLNIFIETARYKFKFNNNNLINLII